MSDERILLDTPHACRQELQRVSNNMVELTAEYVETRERFGTLEAQLDFLRAQTLIGTEGANKEEREAKVLVALSGDPGTKSLVEEWDELRVELEILSQRLRTLEKRGGHAQSAAKSHEQENRFAGVANL